jgi:hypothetical protein
VGVFWAAHAQLRLLQVIATLPRSVVYTSSGEYDGGGGGGGGGGAPAPLKSPPPPKSTTPTPTPTPVGAQCSVAAVQAQVQALVPKLAPCLSAASATCCSSVASAVGPSPSAQFQNCLCNAAVYSFVLQLCGQVSLPLDARLKACNAAPFNAAIKFAGCANCGGGCGGAGTTPVTPAAPLPPPPKSSTPTPTPALPPATSASCGPPSGPALEFSCLGECGTLLQSPLALPLDFLAYLMLFCCT